MEFLQYFVPLMRIVLGLLFIVTSLLKFHNLKGFSVIVASYDVLPKKLVRPLAYIQPFAEFVVGCWILSGRQLFYAAIAGLLLMVVANTFVLFALIKKRKMDNCGCYGVAVKVPLTWKKFYENLVWILLFVFFIIAVL